LKPAKLSGEERSITIVGGGLAGLALGIALQRAGVRATIWEHADYPRHKVCGEFISGQGIAALERLGLMQVIESCDLHKASTARLVGPSGASVQQTLPEPALCIARHKLDALLAEAFIELGGEIVHRRWTEPFADGVVRATGRTVTKQEFGWRFFGLKVHVTGVELQADLEMHWTRAGYTGLCRLPGGVVNVCGLFRTEKPITTLKTHWRNWLSGTCGSELYSRMNNAVVQHGSLCTVAGLGTITRPQFCESHLAIGDSFAMIPPFTGNGMSMAFESAEIASTHVVSFARHEIPWARACEQTYEDCIRRFGHRLSTARFLHQLSFGPPLAARLVFATMRWGPIWRQVFRSTR
jgi:2-polyprenyl-6-methoxyphenol hydroxylase-like FAD-dependent oxidoreductase